MDPLSEQDPWKDASASLTIAAANKDYKCDDEQSVFGEDDHDCGSCADFEAVAIPDDDVDEVIVKKYVEAQSRDSFSDSATKHSTSSIQHPASSIQHPARVVSQTLSWLCSLCNGFLESSPCRVANSFLALLALLASILKHNFRHVK